MGLKRYAFNSFVEADRALKVELVLLCKHLYVTRDYNSVIGISHVLKK